MPVEAALRIDAVLVGTKLRELRVGKILQLGNADAVFAGNHAVQVAGNAHDPRHNAIGCVQHRVVVRVDRNVGMHVAVARMHVHGDESAAVKDAPVYRIAIAKHLRKRGADKNAREDRAHLALPAYPDAAVLQPVEHAADLAVRRGDLERCEIRARGADWNIHGLEKVLPTGANPRHQLAGLRPASQVHIRGLARMDLAEKIFVQGVEQLQFVADRQLDIDAFDGVRVLAQSFQGNYHVLIDLERVGVLGDRGGSGAIEPEFAPRLGVHRNESFAGPGVGDADHMRSRGRHRCLVRADDIAEQHHFRQGAALRFGAVAHRAQIALVQMLQARKLYAPCLGVRFQVALDLYDAGYGIARLTEAFQAHRTGMIGRAMQYPARRGDQTVAAFLLHAGQSAQEFIGYVFAE